MKTLVIASPRKNALSTELMRGLLADVRAAKGEPLLLTGQGDTFSAGLDLKEVAELDRDGMAAFLSVLEELVTVLFEHPAPVVGFVNGHAIAGGCVLALTCDVRIVTAREGVRIGLNEVALGLRFPPATFSMIRRRVSAPKLERVILEAALYDAKAAIALGLVDEVGDEDAARATLARLAAHPPRVYAETKLALRGRIDVPEEEQRRFREETIPFWCSPEQKERMRAALKRK